ncbi:DUF7350 domain-containing protein [Halostagnicola bangensis]
MSDTDNMKRRIDRRRFLIHAGAAAGIAGLAGCTLEFDDESADPDPSDDPAMPQFYEIEDKPDAVYLPTHREAMRMLEPVEAGEYTLAPMLSYPHPFWIISGNEIEEEVPEDGNGVHLMMTVWDTETGIVLPVDSGAQLRVEKNGEQVGSPRTPWPMISQQMGFHFGDNVTLEEDGTHTAEVTLPPLDVRTTGELEGKYEETQTLSFEFEYDQEFREEVVAGVEYFDEDEWGELGALEPMDHGEHDHRDKEDHHHEDDDHEHGDDGHHHDEEDHEHGDDDDHHDHEHDADGEHDDHAHVPYSELPPAEEYPGTHLEPADGDEEATSGDAVFVTTLFEPGSRLVDGDEQYLLVSPRTPYNRVPLADMSLSASVDDGESVSLEQTIDDEFDLHYGGPLEDVESGDDVTVEIDSFPQVARHQGYDTAFLDMPPIELTVPEADE